MTPNNAYQLWMQFRQAFIDLMLAQRQAALMTADAYERFLETLDAFKGTRTSELRKERKNRE